MGGAVGHLYHLYDNPDLTFGEIKDIIQAAASGKLEQVSEKLDGLNLVFTWDESGSGLRVARNAGDIKSGGMDASGLAAKFADRGNLSDAFNSAFRVLNQALGSLPPAARAKVFGPDGRIWYSMELIYSANPNVIQYDSNNIVFHGWPVFKALPDGTVEKGPGGGVGYLSKYIEQMQKNVKEKDWQVRGPALVALKKMSSAAIPKKALTAINRAMAQARVGDDDTIQDYLFNYVLADAKAAKMPPNALQDIAARVAGIPGAPNLTQIKGKIDKALVPIVQEYVKVGPKTIKAAIAPIEAAIHDFAVEALRGLSSTLISNSPGEVNRLQGEVQKAVSAIQSSGNEQAMAILKTQMTKLGNIKNLATPMEGVVFIHNGNAYKFTGAFAPVNQILGLFKYGRGKTKLTGEALENLVNLIVESLLDERGQKEFEKRKSDAQKEVEIAKANLDQFDKEAAIVKNYLDAMTVAGLKTSQTGKGDRRGAIRRQTGWTPEIQSRVGSDPAKSRKKFLAAVSKATTKLAHLDPLSLPDEGPEEFDVDDEYSDSFDSDPETSKASKKSTFTIDKIQKNEWLPWPASHEKLESMTGHAYGSAKTGKTGKEASGVGPGEEWLAYLFGASVAGGSKSYDLVMPDRTTWEVKGLDSETSSIRPGVGGRKAVEKANEALRTVIRQAELFFKDYDDKEVHKAIESTKSVEGSDMYRKLIYAKKIMIGLQERVLRGEIPPDWIGVKLRNALFYLAEFKAKFGPGADDTVNVIIRDKTKKVTRDHAIELARMYMPEALDSFDPFEVASANLRDKAFVDPAQFIDDWFDSVDIDSIFSKVTGGLILVTPKKFFIMPKQSMRDKLIFTKISGGVPKINLMGTQGTEETD